MAVLEDSQSLLQVLHLVVHAVRDVLIHPPGGTCLQSIRGSPSHRRPGACGPRVVAMLLAFAPGYPAAAVSFVTMSQEAVELVSSM